jgi:hypothetical protein
MKLLNKLVCINLFAVLLVLTSCSKSDDLIYNDVAGTYVGTLSSSLAAKSSSKATGNTGVAEIMVAGNQIQVHCYGDNFDTTVMLDLYSDGTNMNVCLTGNEFQQMYGHMLSHNGMNSNMHNNQSEWSQHLINDHQTGDQHFGGFDMNTNSFNYIFNVGGVNYQFNGTKQ